MAAHGSPRREAVIAGETADIPSIVLSRARRALDLGCDGVISSGLEAPRLREHLGDRFLVVCPGIRPGTNSEDASSIAHDDQKRKTTVEEAFRNGADYIVVGRPICGADNPKAAADEIQRTIAAVFDTAS